MKRHGTATVTLPSDREILITRVFDAPAKLVFEAWTTPELVRRWWGDETTPLVVCEIDLRVGGRWRYVTRDPEGTELGWRGVYREVVVAERLVSTELFEAFPEAEAINTMTLVEHDGTTTATVTVLHSSREHRDGHVNSGMETGMQLTFDRLEDLIVDDSAEDSAEDSAGAPDESVGGPADEGGSVAERYRIVAAGFTERVEAVPDGVWERPAPCEGWVARDVVRHIVEWMPAFVLANWGIDPPTVPPVEEDPLAAWVAVRDAIGSALDDTAVASRAQDSPVGRKTFEEAVDMLCITDLLIHTWDLARATGLDEALDPGEVDRTVRGCEGMDPAMDEAMRNSGHYGPRVVVPTDADAQTRLLAFMGRTP